MSVVPPCPFLAFSLLWWLLLFISPESRHLALIAEAPMLDGYEGWSPITRGPELLDVLSPFIVPGC